MQAWWEMSGRKQGQRRMWRRQSIMRTLGTSGHVSGLLSMDCLSHHWDEVQTWWSIMSKHSSVSSFSSLSLCSIYRFLFIPLAAWMFPLSEKSCVLPLKTPLPSSDKCFLVLDRNKKLLEMSVFSAKIAKWNP